MQYFQGKSVYKGIVMGPVAVLKKNDYQVKRARIEDPEAEVKRVKEAVEVSKKQLGRLYDKAVREVGEASAAIFEVHQMMLEDEDYLESMENMIRTELVNAEYAAAATGDNFAEMFAAMDDEYMKARSADVKDISERLVRNLSGEGDNDLSSMEPSVIVADDLSPSETVQMDKEKILAFVTVHGSTNSHTAILARMMNIPALIGVPMDLNGLKTGMTAVVDGFSGQVIFEPEEDVRKETEKRMQEEAEKQKLLEELKGKENITPDGRKINIYANIGSVGDLGYVMENDAGGIGLFRSEFLYLGRNDFPTEEEQFQAYKQAVQTMAGKKVIIRTLDIGADKQVEYFNLGKEKVRKQCYSYFWAVPAAEKQRCCTSASAPGPKKGKKAFCWCRNNSLPAPRAASTVSWGMPCPAWWRVFLLPVWQKRSFPPRAARRCRPFLTQAVPCWCAGRWRSCRTMSTIITATGAVRPFARWRLRPSTS